MDSYPNEFTAHHVPLLFVAGLGSPSSPPQPSANNDPFALLQQSLAKTLASRKSFPLWDTSRGLTAHFHTVLVDKVNPPRPAPREPSPTHGSPVLPAEPALPATQGTSSTKHPASAGRLTRNRPPLAHLPTHADVPPVPGRPHRPHLDPQAPRTRPECLCPRPPPPRVPARHLALP